MAAENDQEKTEQATPKKRQEARKKGQIAQSREIPSVLVLLSGLSFFFFGGGWMFEQLTDIPRIIFQKLYFPVFTPETMHAFLFMLFKKLIFLLAPLMALVIIAGLGGNFLQNGFLVVEDFLTPKLSKLNPAKGIKRLVSVRSLAELVKSLFKVIIIGSIAYFMLRSELIHIPGLVAAPVMDILAFVGKVSLKLGFYTCMVLIVLAGIDLLFQRWQHERDLRMTKQEVKDEYKQREGDPTVRARIKAAQREMAMQRMMESVPDATVVITNPTHLAVALKFDKSLYAPMVVAKGAGHVAAKIKEIATANDIPIMEQKPLARALFKDVEIGQFIPMDLYQAVAEILAYVYRLKGYVQPA
jgi:flagellar biosynthetic protein FlhB